MTDDKMRERLAVIPVAHELPDLWERVWEEQTAECEVYQRTGQHDLRRDEGMTFMCRWGFIGYGWHCVGTRHWTDADGWPCSDRCIYVTLEAPTP